MPSTFSAVGALDAEIKLSWVVVISTIHRKKSDGPMDDFDWDVQGANRRDKRIAELFQNETRQFLVRKVEVGEAGGFTIIFDDEYALDVFPDDSLSDEHWRIFKPSAEEPHFVVTGKGLEN
jgi:hypothetical protein